MKITEISVAYSRTLNIGNFESIRIESYTTATLDPKDTVEKCRDELFQETRKHVSEKIKIIKAKAGRE